MANNVSGAYLIQVLDAYWSAGCGTFLQVSALASHWLEDCANYTPTPEENDTNSPFKGFLFTNCPDFEHDRGTPDPELN